MKFSSAHFKKSSGFTLIELIIVIAILGILAAVVLAAMNPLEQLARGRDAGRISAVSQLGRVAQAYVTNNNNIPFVVSGATNPGTWQDTLTNSKDLSNVITVGLPGGTVACAGGTALSDIQGNICYAVDNASPTRFVVWTTLESQSELLKASGTGTACPAGRGIIAYDSSRGQAQVYCMSATGVGTNIMTGTISQGPNNP